MRAVYGFALCFLLLSCTTKPPTTTPSYLSVPLPFEKYDKIRKNIEQSAGITLKHRGEAHITVITPPEYKNLQSLVKMEEIQKLAQDLKIQQSSFDSLCIGKGVSPKNPQEGATYFVVIHSDKLNELRRKIESLFVSRGGDTKKFSAKVFYPHITLGFTQRDLHFEDGVIKDTTACEKTLQAHFTE